MHRKRKIKDDEIMKLVDAIPGMEVEIIEILSGEFKTQLLRLGFLEGTKIKCLHKLPGGTIIVSKKHQEVALSSNIARKIIVKKI